MCWRGDDMNRSLFLFVMVLATTACSGAITGAGDGVSASADGGTWPPYGDGTPTATADASAGSDPGDPGIPAWDAGIDPSSDAGVDPTADAGVDPGVDASTYP